METTVDNLGLETYYTLEQELKTLQRERDLLNLKIKERLKHIPGLYEEGDYQARLSVQNRSTLNEAMVIEVLKTKNLKECIKLVPTVDREMLELAFYEGKITQKELEHCIDTKYVYTLRVQPK